MLRILRELFTSERRFQSLTETYTSEALRVGYFPKPHGECSDHFILPEFLSSQRSITKLLRQQLKTWFRFAGFKQMLVDYGRTMTHPAITSEKIDNVLCVAVDDGKANAFSVSLLEALGEELASKRMLTSDR